MRQDGRVGAVEPGFVDAEELWLMAAIARMERRVWWWELRRGAVAGVGNGHDAVCDFEILHAARERTEYSA